MQEAGVIGRAKLKLLGDGFVRVAEHSFQRVTRSIEKTFTRLGQNFEKVN